MPGDKKVGKWSGNVGFLTVTKAAHFLGIHPDTLRRWEKRGCVRSKRHPFNQYRLYSKRNLNNLQRRLSR